MQTRHFKKLLMASALAATVSGAVEASPITLPNPADGPGGLFNHNETDLGNLISVSFDINVEAFDPSWGSEVQISIAKGAYSRVFDAGIDFGWPAAPGGNTFTGTIATPGGPDATGTWNIQFLDSFDDGFTPQWTMTQDSSITLNVRQPGGTTPTPGTVGLLGAGLSLLALRRRKHRRS